MCTEQTAHAHIALRSPHALTNDRHHHIRLKRAEMLTNERPQNETHRLLKIRHRTMTNGQKEKEEEKKNGQVVIHTKMVHATMTEKGIKYDHTKAWWAKRTGCFFVGSEPRAMAVLEA